MVRHWRDAGGSKALAGARAPACSARDQSVTLSFQSSTVAGARPASCPPGAGAVVEDPPPQERLGVSHFVTNAGGGGWLS